MRWRVKNDSHVSVNVSLRILVQRTADMSNLSFVMWTQFGSDYIYVTSDISNMPFGVRYAYFHPRGRANR